MSGFIPTITSLQTQDITVPLQSGRKTPLTLLGSWITSPELPRAAVLLLRTWHQT